MIADDVSIDYIDKIIEAKNTNENQIIDAELKINAIQKNERAEKITGAIVNLLLSQLSEGIDYIIIIFIITLFLIRTCKQ